MGSEDQSGSVAVLEGKDQTKVSGESKADQADTSDANQAVIKGLDTADPGAALRALAGEPAKKSRFKILHKFKGGSNHHNDSSGETSALSDQPTGTVDHKNPSAIESQEKEGTFANVTSRLQRLRETAPFGPEYFHDRRQAVHDARALQMSLQEGLSYTDSLSGLTIQAEQIGGNLAAVEDELIRFESQGRLAKSYQRAIGDEIRSRKTVLEEKKAEVDALRDQAQQMETLSDATYHANYRRKPGAEEQLLADYPSIAAEESTGSPSDNEAVDQERFTTLLQDTAIVNTGSLAEKRGLSITDREQALQFIQDNQDVLRAALKDPSHAVAACTALKYLMDGAHDDFDNPALARQARKLGSTFILNNIDSFTEAQAYLTSLDAQEKQYAQEYPDEAPPSFYDHSIKPTVLMQKALQEKVHPTTEAEVTESLQQLSGKLQRPIEGDDVFKKVKLDDLTASLKGVLEASKNQPSFDQTVTRLHEAVMDPGVPSETRDSILRTIAAEKQAVFRNTFEMYNVDPQLQRLLVESPTDPQLAQNIDEKFWKTYAAPPRELVANFSKIQAQLRELPSHEAKLNYISSLKRASDTMPQDQPGLLGLKENIIHELAKIPNITPQHIEAYTTMQEYMHNHPDISSTLREFSNSVMSKDDPLAATKEIISALDSAEDLINNRVTLGYEIVKSKNPQAFVEGMEIAASLSEDTTERQKNLNVERALQEQGLSLAKLDSSERNSFIELIKYKPRDESHPMEIASDVEIAALFRTREISKQYSELLTSNGKRPGLESLPALQEKFMELGLDTQTAEAIVTSWNSYEAYKRNMYDKRKELKLKDHEQLTEEQKWECYEDALKDQPAMIARQIEALSTFAETYGNNELREVIDTFGIYNFVRHDADQLHNQLERWNSSDVLPKNIVVAARTDWNGSQRDAGNEFTNVFGEEGLFYFEANNATEIAKAAVAVGNRERANGRTPAEENSVENFVINAHANPDGLLIGVNGEWLKAADYINSAKNGKANDYRRHLGINYRVILKACRTAGEAMNGKNIKTAIGEGHNVQTEGSPEITQGSIIINADETVIFNTSEGKIPSDTYIPTST